MPARAGRSVRSCNGGSRRASGYLRCRRGGKGRRPGGAGTGGRGSGRGWRGGGGRRRGTATTRHHAVRGSRAGGGRRVMRGRPLGREGEWKGDPDRITVADVFDDRH